MFAGTHPFGFVREMPAPTPFARQARHSRSWITAGRPTEGGIIAVPEHVALRRLENKWSPTSQERLLSGRLQKLRSWTAPTEIPLEETS